MVPLGKLKPDLRSTSCQAKLCRIVGFLAEALAGTMDPFLVLIAVIVIGISLISRSSEEYLSFFEGYKEGTPCLYGWILYDATG